MHWYYWLIIAISLLFSAFFSCADMVYGVVDHDKLRKDAEGGNKLAAKALLIAEDYNFSISAILFGNNIVNIFASSIAALIGIYLSELYKVPGELISTIVLTVVVILFAEFIPKALGKRFNYSLSLFFAWPITITKYIFFIIVWPISKLFSLISKLFKRKATEEEIIDEDVLSEMVDAIEEEGILEENEAELLRGAIDLNDIEAFEIMTPRVDVYAIDVEDDVYELLKNEHEELFKHSRIPVYEDTIDNIIGILPIKALAKKMLNNEEIDIKSLIYKPLTIPRSHQVLDLLNEFKETKIHIAVVIDEYGGTDGIITMEDILEEIIGDIFDENDDIEEEVEDIGNGVYIVDGSMNLDDFFEYIEYSGEEVETSYSTIGGFCQELLDRFAVKGDVINFSHYRLTVLEADEFTVEELKVEDLKYNEEKEE